MNAGQIFYPLIFIFALYFVFLNIKNNLKYKKENIKPLYYLNEDDKTRRKISFLVIIVVVFLTVFLLVGILNTNSLTIESFFTMVLLPFLMVVLYIPLTKRTMISNLGIHKRGALIRWSDIKGVNYLKPNEKNQAKAKISYAFANRDASVVLTFNNEDSQFESFKETVKEYRSAKKKEKKSGK